MPSCSAPVKRRYCLAGIEAGIDLEAGTPLLLECLTVPSKGAESPEFELSIRFPRITSRPSNRTVVASSPGDIPALTVAVLLERLRAALPDLYIIHGNSVIDRATSRPILLIGHSGVGKSTLTRELAKLDRFAVQCEDSLLIRADQGQIHPFPRVASLRVSDSCDAVDALPWPALGGQHLGKVVAPHDHYAQEILPLHRAAVFLLTGESMTADSANSTATETSPETFVLSCLPETLTAALRTRFPHVRIVASNPPARNLPMIAFGQGIQGKPRSELFELLAGEGAMVIRSFHNSQSSNIFRGDRPASPMISLMRPFAALRHMLEHEINFAVPDITPRDVNFSLMQLARAFQSATFHNLVPGGSPADTAAAITALLDSNQP